MTLTVKGRRRKDLIQARREGRVAGSERKKILLGRIQLILKISRLMLSIYSSTFSKSKLCIK